MVHLQQVSAEQDDQMAMVEITMAIQMAIAAVMTIVMVITNECVDSNSNGTSRCTLRTKKSLHRFEFAMLMACKVCGDQAIRDPCSAHFYFCRSITGETKGDPGCFHCPPRGINAVT